jgi:hypothetical protein
VNVQSQATTSDARAANGFYDPEVSPEGETWVLDVYAPALKIIGDFFNEVTGRGTDAGTRFAGTALARLAHHQPPIGVELIR